LTTKTSKGKQAKNAHAAKKSSKIPLKKHFQKKHKINAKRLSAAQKKVKNN